MVWYGMVWAGSKTCSLRLLTRPTQPQPHAAIHSSINSTVKKPTRDKTHKNMSIKEDNYIKGHWKKKQTVGEANTSEEQAKFLVKKQRNLIQTKSHEQRNKKQENALHKCTICHKAFTRKGRRDSHMKTHKESAKHRGIEIGCPWPKCQLISGSLEDLRSHLHHWHMGFTLSQMHLTERPQKEVGNPFGGPSDLHEMAQNPLGEPYHTQKEVAPEGPTYKDPLGEPSHTQEMAQNLFRGPFQGQEPLMLTEQLTRNPFGEPPHSNKMAQDTLGEPTQYQKEVTPTEWVNKDPFGELSSTQMMAHNLFRGPFLQQEQPMPMGQNPTEGPSHLNETDQDPFKELYHSQKEAKPTGKTQTDPFGERNHQQEMALDHLLALFQSENENERIWKTEIDPFGVQHGMKGQMVNSFEDPLESQIYQEREEDFSLANLMKQYKLDPQRIEEEMQTEEVGPFRDGRDEGGTRKMTSLEAKYKDLKLRLDKNEEDLAKMRKEFDAWKEQSKMEKEMNETLYSMLTNPAHM